MMRPLRLQIATEFARWFYHHLQAELAKPANLQLELSFDGRSAGEVNRTLLARLLSEFPGIATSSEPPFNLIEEWARRNRFAFEYGGYIFERYNRLFIERLLALRDNTPDSNDRFREATLSNFREFDYTRKGFSISFLIRVENNMRELLREIMLTLPGIDHAQGWEIIFEQSKDYQETVNEVFEKRLQDARDESDRLLHNILPVSIAAELKKNQRVRPVQIEAATVLFTDFKGFTAISEKMPPEQLIRELDECFSLFDQICAEHRLEKIKTIGDSYMCAGGLPIPNNTHAFDVALAAIRMRDAVDRLAAERAKVGLPYWQVRIGFHTGPVIAGVIGQNKFSYDIWGDTVNTASRMESSGEPDCINVSAASHALLAPFFRFTARGEVAAKSKGKMGMFFLEELNPRYGSAAQPNDEFRKIYGRLQQEARLDVGPGHSR